jgi:ankyrin repeat protein
LELIRRAADVELTNSFGETPLELACELNLQSTAHALVQAGADINRFTDWTTLLSAACSGHLEMVQKLLLWRADPSRQDRKTARNWALVAGRGRVAKLLDAWGSIQVVWVVRSAGQVSNQSVLKRFPKELVRMVWAMLL